MRKFDKIHYSKLALFLVLLSLIISNACSRASEEPEPTNKADKIRELKRKNEEERNRAPIELTAKTVENFPAPSDAEIIPEDSDNKKPDWAKKVISLKSKATVYDAAHFYHRELTNNGWKDEKPDELSSLDARSILSYLRFTKDNEEVDIKLRPNRPQGSEISIAVSEIPENRLNSRNSQNRKNPVPMPACADGSNLISGDNGTTITADCDEPLKSVADFYLEELPKEAWKLDNKTGGKDSDETMILTFTKGNQRAIVSLVRNDPRSTSVNVRVTK